MDIFNLRFLPEGKRERVIEIFSSHIPGGLIEASREFLRKQGVIVGSIDELVCDKHAGAKFKRKGSIPGSKNYNWTLKHGEFNKNKGKLGVYKCEECIEDKNLFTPFLSPPYFIKREMLKTVAYKCPDCGVVKGTYVKESGWPPKTGARGVISDRYYCRICNRILGSEFAGAVD